MSEAENILHLLSKADTFTDYKNALNLRKKAAAAGFFESVHYVFDDAGELAALGFAPCKGREIGRASCRERV